jgi:hypothetical protein
MTAWLRRGRWEGFGSEASLPLSSLVDLDLSPPLLLLHLLALLSFSSTSSNFCFSSYSSRFGSMGYGGG